MTGRGYIPDSYLNMKKIIITLLSISLCIACNSIAQKTVVQKISKQDSIILSNAKSTIIQGQKDTYINTLKYFLNTPYVGGTLDINTKEKLVINLRELDCLTFVENALSLYLCSQKEIINPDNFAKYIKELRYRSGKIKDYSSRLHYSSDWIYDNVNKGIIKDVTKELDGIDFKPSVGFMSSHPQKYKSLKDGKLVPEIKNIEKNINGREYYYIPKKDVANIEDKLQDGDIIFITTDIKGLDISHVGFAIKQGTETHLLHASSYHKKVTISEKTLYNYLIGIKHDTGIIVCRLK